MEEDGRNDLYNFYRRIRKKDLGVTHQNWLKFPEKRENFVHYDRVDGKVESVMSKKTEKPGLILRSNSSEHEEMSKQTEVTRHCSNTNTKNVFPYEPHCSANSPYRDTLNKSFVSPPWLSPLGNKVTQDVPSTTLMNNSTATVMDVVSPYQRKTEKIAASLRASLNDSTVSWTSALATPSRFVLAGGEKQTSPQIASENHALNTEQYPQQKVMGHALFSSHSPCRHPSSGDEWSPTQSIIRCHSPVPEINSELISCKGQSFKNYSNHPQMVCAHETQAFDMTSEFDKEKLTRKRCLATIKPHENARLPLKDMNVYNSDDVSVKGLKTAENISCNLTDRVLDSSKENELKTPEVDSVVSIYKTSDLPYSDHNLCKRVNVKTNISSATLDNVTVTAYDEVYKENPFDIICSPVSTKYEFTLSHLVNNNDLQSANDSFPKPENVSDQRQYDSESTNSDDIIQNKNANTVDKRHLVEGSGQNIDSYEISSLSDQSLNDVSTQTSASLSEKLQDLSHLEGNLKIISSQSAVESKDFTEHFSQRERGHITLRKNLVPLFKRVSETGNNFDLSSKDLGPSTAELTDSSKWQSCKLSLKRKKRLAEVFSYPVFSEEGYEKLNLCFKKNLSIEEDYNKLGLSILDNDIVINDNNDGLAPTHSVNNEHPVSPGKSSLITKKQQNFVSVSNIARGKRPDLSKSTLTNEDITRNHTFNFNSPSALRDQKTLNICSKLLTSNSNFYNEDGSTTSLLQRETLTTRFDDKENFNHQLGHTSMKDPKSSSEYLKAPHCMEGPEGCDTSHCHDKDICSPGANVPECDDALKESQLKNKDSCHYTQFWNDTFNYFDFTDIEETDSGPVEDTKIIMKRDLDTHCKADKNSHSSSSMFDFDGLTNEDKNLVQSNVNIPNQAKKFHRSIQCGMKSEGFGKKLLDGMHCNKKSAIVPESWEVEGKVVAAPIICGFKTARGNSVNISSTSLLNAKKLWEEESLKSDGLSNLPSNEIPTAPKRLDNVDSSSLGLMTAFESTFPRTKIVDQLKNQCPGNNNLPPIKFPINNAAKSNQSEASECNDITNISTITQNQSACSINTCLNNDKKLVLPSDNVTLRTDKKIPEAFSTYLSCNVESGEGDEKVSDSIISDKTIKNTSDNDIPVKSELPSDYNLSPIMCPKDSTLKSNKSTAHECNTITNISSKEQIQHSPKGNTDINSDIKLLVHSDDVSLPTDGKVSPVLFSHFNCKVDCEKVPDLVFSSDNIEYTSVNNIPVKSELLTMNSFQKQTLVDKVHVQPDNSILESGKDTNGQTRVKFTTARGKDVHVNKVALEKAKRIFNEDIDVTNSDICQQIYPLVNRRVSLNPEITHFQDEVTEDNRGLVTSTTSMLCEKIPWEDANVTSEKLTFEEFFPLKENVSSDIVQSASDNYLFTSGEPTFSRIEPGQISNIPFEKTANESQPFPLGSSIAKDVKTEESEKYQIPIRNLLKGGDSSAKLVKPNCQVRNVSSVHDKTLLDRVNCASQSGLSPKIKWRETSNVANYESLGGKIPLTVGFSTANGKSLEVSEKSLKFVKSILRDVDSDVEFINPLLQVPSRSHTEENSIGNRKRDLCFNEGGIENKNYKEASLLQYNEIQNLPSNSVISKSLIKTSNGPNKQVLSGIENEKDSVRNMDHVRNIKDTEIQLSFSVSEHLDTSDCIYKADFEETDVEDVKERTPSPIIGSQVSNHKRKRVNFSCRKGTNQKIQEYPHKVENNVASPRNIQCLNDIPHLSSSPLLHRGKIFEMETLKNYENEKSPKPVKLCGSGILITNLTNENKKHFRAVVNDQTKVLQKYPEIGNPSLDTQEIISMTEAFLRDDYLESEVSPGKKRPLDLDEVESVSCKRKHLKKQVDISMNSITTSIVDDSILSKRELLVRKQLMTIRCKEQQSVQPVQGLLHKGRLEKKKEERICLKNLGPLQHMQEITPGAHKITGDNAKLYRFPVRDESVTVDCGEGCHIIPGKDECIGATEVEQGFFCMPGVQPKFLPQGWVANHYRWIVWKLAALERRLIQRKLLTIENVIARLKYRYDREIDRVERPIIRKITEHDDTPQKTMVLCIAGIKFVPKQNDSVSEKDGSLQNDNTSPLLYLTDGWYGISAVVDCAMAQIIFENKIKIGTKLVIHGAELSGLSSPCHPLEAPSGSCLRLSTNMTRRARWWTRLGLLSCQGPFPVKLTSVLKDGGSVGKIKVMLSRIYPLVYFEKSNGSSIFRGEKAHLRLIKQHQRDKEDILQKVMRNIEREYEKENCDQQVNNFKSLTDEEISSLATGREIALLLETIPDPVRLDNILSAHQLELARSWQHCQAEDRRLKINSAVQRRMTEMQKTYEAVPVLKLRIVDVDGVEAVLSIWRPSEELRQALTEGLAFIIHYVMASGSRKGTLQLTATRQTRWECIDKGSPLSFPETFRVVSPLCLTASVNFNPQWKEVDVVGMVFKIGMVENGYQLVYLVDHLINIVTVKFWGSIKEHGDEDIIHLESILSLSNGSWRGHGNKKYGCIHVTELTAFSILPKSAHFVEAVAHFKESIKDMKALVQKANMKLNGQNTECTCPSLTKPHLDIACNHKCMGEQREYENRVSSPVDTDTGKPQAVSTPNRLEQHSKDLKRKMKALGQYGIPSPIRMFSTASSSVGTGKPFKVPLKQDSPSS